ncbi:MAG: hypothetical protein P8O16_03495 [Algoriphagus sp.]|uniref:hypothetical protein n=1 Tax=Algoriphagus sp. TaxID=1872435 RepID=UPI00262527B0|nr:hypothetical protein [Algoriphagus sp.]MDG1276318.1 hypothetical protein [Algoriphagus sp.]
MITLEKYNNVLNTGCPGKYSREQVIQLKSWIEELVFIEIEILENQLTESKSININKQKYAA